MIAAWILWLATAATPPCDLWLHEATDRVADAEMQLELARAERETARHDRYAASCETTAGRATAAQRRFAQADCHRLGKDLAIAEVDVTYFTEVLASVVDLRENDAATRQQVLRAELDLERARRRVAGIAPRVERCIASGAAAGRGPG